jgi:hypothetical protein
MLAVNVTGISCLWTPCKYPLEHGPKYCERLLKSSATLYPPGEYYILLGPYLVGGFLFAVASTTSSSLPISTSTVYPTISSSLSSSTTSSLISSFGSLPTAKPTHTATLPASTHSVSPAVSHGLSAGTSVGIGVGASLGTIIIVVLLYIATVRVRKGPLSSLFAKPEREILPTTMPVEEKPELEGSRMPVKEKPELEGSRMPVKEKPELEGSRIPAELEGTIPR